MSPRSSRSVGFAAALLTLASSGAATAQSNLGTQIERRVMNQVGAAINPQYGPGPYAPPGPQGGPNNAYGPPHRGPYANPSYPSPYGQPYANRNAYPPYGYPNQGAYQPPQPGFSRAPQPGGVVQAGGQRYQVPAQYAGYPAGSVISYGGSSYVVSGDGSMIPSSGTNPAATRPPSAPAPAQRFQIPAQYAGTAPNHVINYGGTNYLTNDDGTMSPYSGAVAR